MVIYKKIEELGKDYKFFIRCKRVVWNKPKLVKQINKFVEKIETDYQIVLRDEKLFNKMTNKVEVLK